MKLTDDELAAFAVANGRAWRGHLPTVDESSVESLLESVRRGGTSLLARGLDPTSDEGEPDAAALRSTCGKRPVVHAYVADQSTLDRPVALVTEVYSVDDSRVLVDLATQGLHDLQLNRAEDAATFLLETCRQAFETDDDGLRFVVISGSTSPTTISVIGQGSHEVGQAQAKDSGGFDFVRASQHTSLDVPTILDPVFVAAG